MCCCLTYHHKVPGSFSLAGLLFSAFAFLFLLLAFCLPFWVYIAEDVGLVTSAARGHVEIQYNYGFWRYCIEVIMDTKISYQCSEIVNHADWEQLVICLIILATLAAVNSVLNSSLYLTILRKERLCLQVALGSAIGSGITVIVALVYYGLQDQSITVTESIHIAFRPTHLHLSYWLATASAGLDLLAASSFLLEIKNHRTNEEDCTFSFTYTLSSRGRIPAKLYHTRQSAKDIEQPEVPELPVKQTFRRSASEFLTDNYSGEDISVDVITSEDSSAFYDLTNIEFPPRELKAGKEKIGAEICKLFASSSSHPVKVNDISPLQERKLAYILTRKNKIHKHMNSADSVKVTGTKMCSC